MSTAAHPILKKIQSRYRFLRTVESALIALGLGLGAYALLPADGVASLIGAGLIAGLVFAIYVKWIGLTNVNEVQVAFFLNRSFEELQDSTDLLAGPAMPTSPLEQLQQKRTSDALEKIISKIKLPHRLPLSFGVLAVGILLLALAPHLATNKTTFTHGSADAGQNRQTASDSMVSVLLEKITVRVTPPAYTGLPGITSNHLAMKVREGSSVTWSLQFKGSLGKVQVVFSGKDSIFLPSTNGTVNFNRKITEAGFYQLHWQSGNARNSTDFFPIEVIPDEPPSIHTSNLPQFVELQPTDVLKVSLQSHLHDDYAVNNAHIIATVAKGSGESVKFREEKLAFNRPAQFGARDHDATRIIDLHQLGLEPGDELYFYIEAFDNKYPLPNKSRTETFFIAVQDTADAVTVSDEGLGVDLMPEYFRSQRQIIIDSEKLLGEKKKIEKQDFNSRSNELGYDQKVLRLRYGQFLGEEFETAIARVDEVPEGEELDVTKQFGHQHDTENEHNQVADKKKEPEPDHHDDHAHEGDEKENPFEAFVHSHDNAEEATFFIQSVKTKLRAALTLMWDAELYLRMYQPEQSLPYQYKILKLLKEISNDSRVYVHRTGFDPPPLKEEKRLSGDLSEVKTTSANTSASPVLRYPGINAAIKVLGSLSERDTVLMESQKVALRKAGNEVAGIAIQNPGGYLNTLSALKTLTEETVPAIQLQKTSKDVLKALWQITAPGVATPGKQENALHPLDKEFLQHLQTKGND